MEQGRMMTEHVRVVVACFLGLHARSVRPLLVYCVAKYVRVASEVLTTTLEAGLHTSWMVSGHARANVNVRAQNHAARRSTYCSCREFDTHAPCGLVWSVHNTHWVDGRPVGPRTLQLVRSARPCATTHTPHASRHRDFPTTHDKNWSAQSCAVIPP